jgi:hypothetical protein
MGRPDRVCPFASARWGVFSPFFVCADAFGRALVEWIGPLHSTSERVRADKKMGKIRPSGPIHLTSARLNASARTEK